MQKLQKNNKYSHFNTPQDEFDYHGLNPLLRENDIAELTEKVIDDFKKQKKIVIRLIVGKGNRSKNGAVIKPWVERHLQKLFQSRKIQSFQFDGMNTGAFVVKL